MSLPDKFSDLQTLEQTLEVFDETIEDLEKISSRYFEAKQGEPLPVRPAKSHFVQSIQVHPTSPKLLAISEMANRDQAIYELYLRQKGKGPIVEEIPGDPSKTLVTFLYLGDEDTRMVWLSGGPVVEPAAPLNRFGRSHVWFLTAPAALDSRFGYNFHEEGFQQADGKEIVVQVLDLLDDLNPEFTTQGSSRLEFSRAALDASPPPTGRRAGAVFEECLDSKILGSRRWYDLYVPADSHPEGIAIFFDGESFSKGWPDQEMGPFVRVPEILDRLIEEGKLPPLLAVFVHAGSTRNEDLLFNPLYADFLADELLPRVARRDRRLTDPRRVIAAGTSFGGLCAAYSAMQRSESIGNVLSLSGSFWVDRCDVEYEQVTFQDGALQREFLHCDQLPIRFFLESGIYEVPRIVLTNRQFRDVLIAKGYDVLYREYPGNHEYTHWAWAMVDGLLSLTESWPRPALPICLEPR